MTSCVMRHKTGFPSTVTLMVFNMKYYTLVFVSLINSVSMASAQVPEKPTPLQQLKAACVANPQHEICVARQAKADRMKQKREAKTMAAVEAILSAKPTH